MTLADFTIACTHYSTFLESYAKPHNYNGRKMQHSIPASFLYSLVKDNCIWLLNLIMGVAGYSVYFDSSVESSRVISKEMLDEAGVKDPCLTVSSKIEPWIGLTSSGKSPFAPVDSNPPVPGVGIAHFNKGGLASFYYGNPIQATLPKIDPVTHEIVRVEGVMQTDKYTISVDAEPIYGWGMSYGDKRLPISLITNSTDNFCYENTKAGRCVLKGKLKDSYMKLIGSSYGKPMGETFYMTKEESLLFKDWCQYHLNESRDKFYPPLLWMSKYWAPFLSWHDGTRENTLQVVMLASAVYNSGGLKPSDLQGASLQEIADKYIAKGGTQLEKNHFQRRVANTLRAIALVEFIKRV